MIVIKLPPEFMSGGIREAGGTSGALRKKKFIELRGADAVAFQITLVAVCGASSLRVALGIARLSFAALLAVYVGVTIRHGAYP